MRVLALIICSATFFGACDSSGDKQPEKKTPIKNAQKNIPQWKKLSMNLSKDFFSKMDKFKDLPKDSLALIRKDFKTQDFKDFSKKNQLTLKEEEQIKTYSRIRKKDIIDYYLQMEESLKRELDANKKKSDMIMKQMEKKKTSEKIVRELKEMNK